MVGNIHAGRVRPAQWEVRTDGMCSGPFARGVRPNSNRRFDSYSPSMDNDIDKEANALADTIDIHWKQANHRNDPDCERCRDLRQQTREIYKKAPKWLVIFAHVSAWIRHPIKMMRRK